MQNPGIDPYRAHVVIVPWVKIHAAEPIPIFIVAGRWDELPRPRDDAGGGESP